MSRGGMRHAGKLNPSGLTCDTGDCVVCIAYELEVSNGRTSDKD